MIKLTQTVKKGGCAAKVPATILREILDGLNFPPKIDGLSIDGSQFDDAAIYNITESVSLVQTLDFFTPIVDSPTEFGAIAAANALSDVYAMGGRPKTCMAILAAPLATMEPKIIQEVLQGACDVIALSGASLVGGHSIDDDTLKFGLSVTGTVHPEAVWTNQGARSGDILILTKPLGTGTICAGIKKETLSELDSLEARDSMKRLNNIIDFLASEELGHIHGATDITGFGFLGHSYQMALASKVTLNFSMARIPVFKMALSCLEQGHLTKAHRSNEEYTRNKIKFSDSISDFEKLITFDPQTSGGLLLSVEPSFAEKIVKKLTAYFPGTSVVGRVQPASDTYVCME
jgi:selenide,water dikinase